MPSEGSEETDGSTGSLRGEGDLPDKRASCMGVQMVDQLIADQRAALAQERRRQEIIREVEDYSTDSESMGFPSFGDVWTEEEREAQRQRAVQEEIAASAKIAADRRRKLEWFGQAVKEDIERMAQEADRKQLLQQRRCESINKARLNANDLIDHDGAHWDDAIMAAARRVRRCAENKWRWPRRNDRKIDRMMIEMFPPFGVPDHHQAEEFKRTHTTVAYEQRLQQHEREGTLPASAWHGSQRQPTAYRQEIDTRVTDKHHESDLSEHDVPALSFEDWTERFDARKARARERRACEGQHEETHSIGIVETVTETVKKWASGLWSTIKSTIWG